MLTVCGVLALSWVGGAARAEDPWGRPEHLRALQVPPERWAERDAALPIRVF